MYFRFCNFGVNAILVIIGEKFSLELKLFSKKQALHPSINFSFKPLRDYNNNKLDGDFGLLYIANY